MLHIYSRDRYITTIEPVAYAQSQKLNQLFMHLFERLEAHDYEIGEYIAHDGERLLREILAMHGATFNLDAIASDYELLQKLFTKEEGSFGNNFCKVEDSLKNQYILTDKFKQPLQCDKLKNSCVVANFKKIIDNPALLNDVRNKSPDSFNNLLLEDTKIPCKYGSIEPIDKSKINFNIYNTATIKKDIVIKDIKNKQYTDKEIESFYELIYFIDNKNIQNINELIKEENEFRAKGKEPSDEFKLKFIKINIPQFFYFTVCNSFS
jgi:hypothetical protein